MTLKFVVIPTKKMYEDYSVSVMSKINNINNCEAQLDEEYTESSTVRINQNKKRNKNVIAIGNSEVEHDMILLHFNGKNIRPKSMELDDFISLLESYECEETEEDEDEDDMSNSSDDDDDLLDMFTKSNKPKKQSNTQQPQNQQTQRQEQRQGQDQGQELKEKNNDEFELECVVC